MRSYYVSVKALIALLRDGEKGFADLSLHIYNDHCRVYMIEESYMRQCFAAELAALLSAHVAEAVDSSGTTVGTLHRAWLDLRSEFGASDADLLDALATCERTAVVAYAAVLKDETLPGLIRAAIERQLRHVQPLHKRLTNLCACAPDAQSTESASTRG